MTPTILLFQMTVATTKHDTVAEPIKKVIQGADVLDMNLHGVFFIFTTDGDTINKAEPYLATGKDKGQLRCAAAPHGRSSFLLSMHEQTLFVGCWVTPPTLSYIKPQLVHRTARTINSL